ncbi:hypothetical protein BH11ACT8_BH11ACT8_00420 [soil metagenome]
MRVAQTTDAPTTGPDGTSAGWARRTVWTWASAPLWARSAVVYLALRLVSGLLLAQAADQQVWFPGITGPREGDVDLALSWDAQWYQRIADDGYPDTLPVGEDGRVQQNPWAFYPLFPYAARFVGSVTGLDFATVAPLLALLAGLGAALLMAQLLHETSPYARTGPALAAVAVWAAFPASPVLQMAYTESFSMLLLVAFLLLLVRHRWWAAGAFALLLGITRPIALPLSLVVVTAVWMRWRERAERPIPVAERAAIAAAVVATGVSGVLWTTIAWWGTGRRDAYPATMTAWRGKAAIDPVEPWRKMIGYAFDYRTHDFVVPSLSMVLALVISLVVLVPKVSPGTDLRLRVWCAAYAVYLLAVVDGNTSIVRYLVPLFPLALVAVGAHRARPARLWRVRTAFWVVAGIVGQVGWIWWLVLFTPPSDYPP